MKAALDHARGTRLALLVALGGIVLFWGALLLHEPRFFWCNDYQLWYSPIFEESVRAWHEGEWPILTTTSWAAGNLGGEYQAGTFSVWQQAVLVALWLLPLTMPGQAAALALVHLLVTAAGVVMLGRERGFSPHAAALAALVTATSGWLITWGASQWLVALSGFAWVPWAWWSFLQARATQSLAGRWILPALFVYLTITAGGPFAVVMLAIVTAWEGVRAWRSAGTLVAAWSIGLALSAPAWWMLLELQAYSVRQEWGLAWQHEWLVPWRAWLGLIVPGVEFPWRDFWGNVEARPAAVLTGGLVPVAVLGSWRHWRRSAVSDVVLVVLLMLLCSVPLVGSFRWSFRFLPLFHLALALAAGAAARRGGFKLAPYVAVGLFTAAALISIMAAVPGRMAFLGVSALLLVFWCGLASLRLKLARWAPCAAVLGLAGAAYMMLDLERSSFMYRYPMTENLRATGPLERSRLYLNVFSSGDQLRGLQAAPGWGAILRPGNTAMCAGLHFVGGYSSFRPYGVGEWFETFGMMPQVKAEALLSPQADGLLALLGVDGLIVGHDYRRLGNQLGREWQLAHDSDEATVYHRPPRFEPVRVVPLTAPVDGLPHALAGLRLDHAGRQEVRATILRPALEEDPCAVVFARPSFPGYEATLDGRPLAVKSFAGDVPMVELPAGKASQLVLTFRPASLRFGVPIALSTLALCVLGALVSRRFQRHIVL